MGKTGNEARVRAWRRVWKIVTQSVMIIALEFLIGGLLILKNMSHAQWQNEMKRFHWLVLVKGDMVVVDEVGRFLAELDGVREVKLMERDQIIQKLSQEQLWPKDAPNDAAQAVPHSWLVQWKENPQSLADHQSTLADIHKKEGVVDVAFDPHALERVRGWRRAWLSARLGLGGALLLFLIGFGIIFGRYIFFTPSRRTYWRAFGTDVLFHLGAWGTGYALMCLVFGFLPPFIILGGLLTGMMQYGLRAVDN